MGVRTTNAVAVIYKQTFLTGLSAGKTIVKWIVCNSRASANATAKEFRTEKVMETGLTNELFKVSKVKVVPFNKAVPFDYLAAYKE